MSIAMRAATAVLSWVVLAPSLTAPDVLSAQPPAQAQAPAVAPSRLVVPAGFQVTAFADSVQGARSMALGPGGTVFVGSQRAGKVHAVVDRDRDGRADRVVVIASGLDMPNGVAVRDGALYVATTSQILRYDDIERRFDAPPAPVVVRDSLPNPDRAHTWKFIAFGPDDLLYMSVGAPCNVCLSPPLVSAIVRMTADVMVAKTDGRRVTSYEPLVTGFIPSGAPGGWEAMRAAGGRWTCSSCRTARSSSATTWATASSSRRQGVGMPREDR